SSWGCPASPLNKDVLDQFLRDVTLESADDTLPSGRDPTWPDREQDGPAGCQPPQTVRGLLYGARSRSALFRREPVAFFRRECSASADFLHHLLRVSVFFRLGVIPRLAQGKGLR